MRMIIIAVAFIACAVPQAEAQQSSHPRPIYAAADVASEKPAAAAEKPTAVQLEVWRGRIVAAPRPGRGCYAVNYPDTQWHKVACKPKWTKLYPPRLSSTIVPQLVGEGTFGGDFAATVTGHITEAQGSFDPNGTVVGSESTVGCDESTDRCAPNLTPTSAGAVANDFSLQLNSAPFNTEVCNGAAGISGHPCQGWQQFIYSSEGGGNIQYWLIHFGPPGSTCPASFPITFTYPGVEVDCAQITADSMPLPTSDPTSLPQIVVTGSAAGVHGPTDELMIFVGGSGGHMDGSNLFPDLGSQWQGAEFNVFGDGNNSQAAFSSGSTVVPRVGVTSGTTNGPGCDLISFTGESNNLTLGNVPPTSSQETAASGVTPMPALVFTEEIPPLSGAPAGCVPDAASIGDTHLTRLDGLKYDFQATGDFLLAQAGDLIVQTRQALSVTNPNWIKNAAINKAVAVQMGKTRVALYIWPVRLVVDGKTTDLGEGQLLSLPGVNLALRNGIYVIASTKGDVVFVTANDNGINTWLDVWVRLGHAPTPDAAGLLGNPGGDAHSLTTADGAVLRTVSFADLYHRYADSWRLTPDKSMLEPDATVAAGVPDKPLFASDLDGQSAQKARAACVAAGVTAQALLDDCILDTAVLGDATAARVYTILHLPRAVLPRPMLAAVHGSL